jgi:hypothetical protein
MKPDPEPPEPPNKNPTHDDIAKRAFALYEKEGRPKGRAVQNGLEAEGKTPPAAVAPSFWYG